MKRFISILIVTALVAGLFTGCGKNSNVNDPDVPDITAKPIPIGEPNSTETPETLSEELPAELPEELPQIMPEDEFPEMQIEREYGTLIENNPDNGDEWNAVIDLFNDFLNGKAQAGGLNKLCEEFTSQDEYSICEIGDIFNQYLDNFYMCQRLLTSIRYAVIEGPDNPYLAVKFTYDDLNGYDGPYEEIMFFYDSFGWLVFVDSLTSFYRGYSWVNECGYCYSGGSSGANRDSANYYYLGYEGSLIHVCNEQDVYNLVNCTIDSEFIPTDTTLDILDFNYEYEEQGYTLRAVTLSDFREDAFIDDYDAYLRTYYYVFYDSEGNNVMPDEDYVAKCKADGIDIITEAELNEHLAFEEDFFGITEEKKNAPELLFANNAPEGAWGETTLAR